MTIKRKRDPAGLLPDAVHIELEGKAGETEAILDLLRSNAPQSRIKRLRRHKELSPHADALEADFAANTHNVHALLVRLAQAETRALYLDAAPGAVRDAGRQKGTKTGGKASGEARRRFAAKSKQRAVDRFRLLIATGDRDSDEAIAMMINEGWSRATLYRHLEQELAKLGRARKKPVKSK